MPQSNRWMGVLIAMWLSTQASVADAEKPTLDQVIKRVRENERLYRNIEMTVEWEYRSEAPVNAAIPPEKKKKSVATLVTTKIQVVHADGRFLYRADRSSEMPGIAKKEKSQTVGAWDGARTRIFHRFSSGTYASIYDIRYLQWDVVMPNTLLMTKWNPKPLSKLLRIRDIPDTHYHWDVVGEEKVDGVDCVKLKFETVAVDSGRIIQRSIVWLAVNRNYQPAKFVSYRPSHNVKLPHSIGRVTKFMRLKGTVWLPSKTALVVYNSRELTEGRQVVNYRTAYTVKAATLNPKADDSIFKAAKIPKGAHVLEYRDGKVVKSYRQK